MTLHDHRELRRCRGDWPVDNGLAYHNWWHFSDKPAIEPRCERIERIGKFAITRCQ